jgi:4-aminobutyrate aminotransferase-like enzyme
MHDNVIKLKPPMCFTEEDAERVCKELGEVMAELEAAAAVAAQAS